MTEGLHSYRLDHKHNHPREQAFASAWADINQAIEEYVSIEPLTNTLIPNATERDKIIAATIIQWLGSNVGMEFICRVLSQPEFKNDLLYGLEQHAKKTTP